MGTGATSADTVVDARGLDRVFEIGSAHAVVTLVDITVRDGEAVAGGGIRNHGTLHLIECAVEDNHAGISGGGLMNLDAGSGTSRVGGELVVDRSTIARNRAEQAGGGIEQVSSPLSRSRSRAATSIRRASSGAAGSPADLFPGPCARAGALDAVPDCVEAIGRCHACRALAAGVDLDVDCDLFDDGASNGSCP